MSKNRNGIFFHVFHVAMGGLVCAALVLLARAALVATRYGLSTFAEEEFRYDAGQRRNPFIPLVTSDGRLLQLDKVEKKGAVVIEGIVYDKYGLSYVLVNGEVARVGDFVGDKQVLRIEPKKVVFIKEGQVEEVELQKEE